MSPLALVSVSDKRNIIPFCKELVEQFNYKILSSGGTAKHLIEAKIPVIKVADFTNSPEILGGRVKTLHPKIHGGILAKRNDKEHKEDIEANNIELIDLVVVNLYPFKKTVDQGAKWEDAIENIDIGGPSMIRSAAKNHKDVSVLVDPGQYQNFLEESKKGELKDSYKAKLAFEAFQHTADYDTAISNWISKEKGLQHSKYIESYPLIKTLRYGENPHQKAFWYGLSNIGWNSAEQLQGKELSYNNLLDLESALSTVLEFGYEEEKSKLTTDTFASVILKHNNPCGASISNSTSQAFLNALKCDTVSAFGGIVAFNANVDTDTANNLKDIFLECVVAPSFDAEALEILKIKKNLRILKLSKDNLSKKNQTSTKSIMGGLLVQDTDDSEEQTESWISVTRKIPNNQMALDLNFAWKICKHVKSNAIVIAKDQKTIGIGAGQMNRVGAAKIALKAAGSLCSDAVLASDGFFPFADTVELANEYGIRAIVQPGGSLRDQESIDMCDTKGISMVFTQKRHFLH
ncbi:bifunctional phosphoribosylaminoimidazolecarboxamide formyltransferase/inosine monophosphate cyclohydrolase [Prochlorococcus marinus str. MU1404]|uniref:bifunctional phosphoribosylaminoimidazolecarboxamide formyltransferase/IMP cyclohydrolase n=1 Tax=Prochlorococcus marinus TaxID=1219 RepID=UPI001AD961EE|nr:bifunctional phosphoribosylaminoimidazolecarboxamide formyltransferase/IMP cyclohydrolase [Prochlorococcus marinus]MBO8229438.1 bifunctional phosphoribosylaminoimidazolecarboxamide formyltransferase/IMP cyclohydrolase [Prochlorococcus marinus XMU1404]MBW3072521.1 bifunctional phosphoribosylaminoimidazolecarboxamide formyltransferase/inosine monophosphate cyclohydrolase [Prochlorococcus marinus str. MU1404]MCR8544378.1 bifunctional phosphoribosylaminoimidazolecarboxamide formyltransferase/IMP 